MKTAVIYYSKHHNNTKKLLEAISEKYEIDVFDITRNPCPDLCKYDLVGFASGIYYSKFNKKVIGYAEKYLPENKNVFFIYTYGAKKKAIHRQYQQLLRNIILKYSGNSDVTVLIRSVRLNS